MKAIKLKNLQLTNFKGVRNLEINFSDDETFIYGDNATYKTTTVDSFSWLLFGKDSIGRSDFEVKTLDAAGVIIPKIEHEVSALLLIDGVPLKLKRVLKEKWVKKKGNTTPEFSGNETEYYWNDVPVQQKEYQSNISQLLDEQVFKLITSVSAFNSMDWKARRGILNNMVTINENEIVGQNVAFQKLMEDIKGHKSIEDYKKMKNASIKKSKEDLANIPTRIDEVNRNKPEAKDFDLLKISLQNKEKELNKIDEQIQDKTKAVEGIVEQKNAHTLKVNGVQTKISMLQNSIKNEADKQVNDSKGDYNKVLSEINNLQTQLDSENSNHTSLQQKKISIEKEIEAIIVKMNDLRTSWSSENSKTFVFDETACKCPTCNRALETSDITAKKDELLKNFNSNKEKSLNEINLKGSGLKAEKEKLENDFNVNITNITNSATKVNELNALITSSKAKLETLKEDPAETEKKAEMIYETMLSNNAELITLNNELTELHKITFAETTVDTSELKELKVVINKEINSFKTELLVEDEIKKADERIKQLMDEESILAQLIADVEKDIIIADEYSKAKIDALESQINKKFMYVKFKLFDRQINGGESECCEATVKGVPFSDTNTASKINAGIDIINTLTEFYNISAPIFIDNRESVVNVLPTHSQLINLVVSASDKKLRVA
jgi:DNA repair exonuclease SbcCD ATPase subunit